MVTTSLEHGRVGMAAPMGDALAAFRQFDYENIYLRPASVHQGQAVVDLLRALVEHYADRPNSLPAHQASGLAAGSTAARHAAVSYVAGMTDRFACQQAVGLLGWDPARLPLGVDTFGLRR
jgi:dGTPase